MGILSSAKDRVVEQVALSYLNSKLLAPYGRATDLRIDSTEKTISVEVQLNGESVPVKVDITSYDISREDDRYFATIKEIQTSREWLTALARNKLLNERFERPAQAGRLLTQAL